MTDSVERIFEKAGAVLHGHFLLTSGLHSPVYWEKAKVIQYPVYTEQLCRMIADRFRGAGASVVAGPTTPGIILAYEVARQLGTRGIFAERDESGGSGRVFRRGFTIDPGEKVLVVDDILTTGGSVNEVIAAVQKLGGAVVGIGILVDRSPVKIDFGFPLFACHRVQEVAYPPDRCPLCAAGVPLVKPGSSKAKG
ncbi:MAG: orotate phosphoribosyltransferase [Chloroflexi bacterium RBG_13_57_8]|nr:MAG: orotate phosphoribosyltransferase [Chloroflexi bacterium RBG_13_57_8]